MTKHSKSEKRADSGANTSQPGACSTWKKGRKKPSSNCFQPLQAFHTQCCDSVSSLAPVLFLQHCFRTKGTLETKGPNTQHRSGLPRRTWKCIYIATFQHRKKWQKPSYMWAVTTREMAYHEPALVPLTSSISAAASNSACGKTQSVRTPVLNYLLLQRLCC